MADRLFGLLLAGVQICLYTLVGLLVIVAISLSLGRVLLADIDVYREQVAGFLQAELGVPVELAQVSGHWSGFDPVLTLHDLSLHNPFLSTPDKAMQIESLDLRVSLGESLWQKRLVLKRVDIGSLDLDARLALNLLAGDESPTVQRDDPKQQAFAMLAGLTQLDVPLIVFNAVRISLPVSRAQNRSPVIWQVDDLRLIPGRDQVEFLGALHDVATNQGLAGFHIRLDTHAGSLAGEAYVTLEHADLISHLTALLNYPLSFRAQSTRGELWLSVADNQLNSARMKLDIRALEPNFKGESLPVLESVRGNVVLAFPEPGGFDLRADDLQATLLDGASILGPRLVLGMDPEGSLQLATDQVDLGAVTHWLSEVNYLGAGLQRRLRAYAPKGQLRRLHVARDAQTQSVKVTSLLRDMQVAAFEGSPAASGINGYLVADEHGGQVVFQGQGANLHFPDLYSRAWVIREAEGHLAWSLFADSFAVRGKHLSVRGLREGQLSANGSFRLFVPHDHSMATHLTLSVAVPEGEARLARRLSPDRLMPVALTEWLQDALQEGVVYNSGFHLAGPIGNHSDPEQNPAHLFLNLRDTTLNYHPDWPPLTGASGQLTYQDGQLEASITRGESNQEVLQQPIRVVIDGDRGERSLRIRARHALTQEALQRWLVVPALARHVGSSFDTWRVAGTHPLDIEVRLGLDPGQTDRVRLDLELDHAGLDLGEGPLCSQMVGRVVYDSLTGVKGKANTRCLDRALMLELSTLRWVENRGRLRLWSSGLLSAADLPEAWLQLLPVGLLSGSARFSGELEIPVAEADAEYTARLSSDLAGLGIDLPAPLGKPRGLPRALHLDGRFSRPDNSDWTLKLAGVGHAQINLRRGDLQRAWIHLSQDVTADPAPAEHQQRGVYVRGEIARIDIPAWTARLEDLPAETEAIDKAAVRPPWFGDLDLQVGSLTTTMASYSGVGLQLSADDEQWRLRFGNGVSLQGSAYLPYEDQGVPRLALESLWLPEPAAGDSPESALQPLDLPRFDLSVERLRVGARQLGRWSLSVVPKADRVEFQNLNINIGDSRLSGQLSWLSAPTRQAQRTLFTGEVSGREFESLYEQWSGKRAPLTAENYTLNTRVNWQGPPQDFAWVNLNGQIELNMSRGAFRDVGTGGDLFRLFGVLNTDALTRRLRLDFSDLYGDGLAYDLIEGKAVIREGVVQFIQPLAVQAPSSAFKLTGRSDLATSELDMQMVVVLPLTQNLPLAALLVGAPQVGGALFLIDQLLGDSLSNLTSATYQISGSMQEPQVTLQQLFQPSGDESS